MLQIPRTELSVYGLCLGGNVFGGRSSEEQSFAVLDAYARRAATSSIPLTSTPTSSQSV